MKKYLIIMASVVVMVSLSSIANALPLWFADFQAKYPNASNITCGVCHTTQSPRAGVGFARNPYGLAFQALPHVGAAIRNAAFVQLEIRDSDGDGFTNLTEIAANTPAIHVLPGFANLNAAFPGTGGFRATPPRLLFFDNFSNARPRVVPNWTFTGGGIWGGVNVAGNFVLLSPGGIPDRFASPTPPGAPAAPTNFRAGTIEAQVQFVSGDQADIVFALTPADFRFVGMSTDGFTIGQDSSPQQTTILNPVFLDGQPHVVKVVVGPRTLAGSRVSVSVDGGPVLGSRLFGNLATGQVGVRTKTTRARFDNVRISK